MNKMNQELFKLIPAIVDKLKKQCNYIKGRSCSNCKYFGNISGHGYSYQFCKDVRNEIPHEEGEWITGIPVEPDGLCNYWELTDGRLF